VILCIDCGNSRLKWGLRDAGEWHATAALPLSFDQAPVLRARRVLACNVAGEAGRQAIAALVAQLEAPVEWLHSRPAQCGVINGYEHPEQLGADRWAALIGARARHAGACLVVMSGTATTVDVLAADGRFNGGLILPGLALMRDALAGNTANLPSAAGRFVEQPRNTFDAISSGCLQATAGAIERMFRQVAGQPDARCLLSGGAATELAAQLTVPYDRVDNLVLDGLATIAESGPAS
jgi:type III pantothenate kinase